MIYDFHQTAKNGMENPAPMNTEHLMASARFVVLFIVNGKGSFWMNIWAPQTTILKRSNYHSMSVSVLRITAHLLHKGPLLGNMRPREWPRCAHESRKKNHRSGRGRSSCQGLFTTMVKRTAEFICKIFHGVCQEFAGNQESVGSALAGPT